MANMVDLIHWHTFDGRLLGRNSIVVDLGANRGEFLSKVGQAFKCGVMVAVEPNPKFSSSLARREGILAINAAVGGTRGSVKFIIDENDLASRVTLNDAVVEKGYIDVELITLDDVFRIANLTHIDLLKIDIEGQEIPMLDAASDDLLSRVGQITIEFHDFCGLISEHEVKRALARFKSLGFVSAKMSRVGHQDTWLINTRIHPISAAVRVKVFFLKYFRGAMRVWHKLTKGDKWYLAYD